MGCMNKIGGLVNVNILVELLYYAFANVTIGKNLVKYTKNSPLVFLTIARESTIISIKLSVKKKMSEIVICAA